MHSDYSVQLQPSPPCQVEVNPSRKCSRVHLHTLPGTFPRAPFAKWPFIRDECNRLGQSREALRCRPKHLQVRHWASVCDVLVEQHSKVTVCKMAVHAGMTATTSMMQQIGARSGSAAMSTQTSTGQGRAFSVRRSLNNTVR